MSSFRLTHYRQEEPDIVAATERIIVQLERSNPLLHLLLLEVGGLYTFDADGPVAFAQTGGKIGLNRRFLRQDPAVLAGINVVAPLSLSAQVFILAHEVCHLLLGHLLPFSEWPAWQTQARQQQAERLEKAIEMHANAFATQFVGDYPPRVIPIDNTQPVYEWDKALCTGSPLLGLKDIFDRLASSPSSSKQQSPQPVTLGVLDNDEDYPPQSAAGPTIMTQDQLDRAIARAIAGSGVDPTALGGDLGDVMLDKQAKALPWDALLRHFKQQVRVRVARWTAWARRGTSEPVRRKHQIRAQRYALMVYVDTSGSMSEELLVKILSALAQTDERVEITYRCFDTSVYPPHQFEVTDTSAVLEGGGGTDFEEPARAWTSEDMGLFDGALCVTDGESSAPTETLVRWVWLLTEGNGNHLNQQPVYLSGIA